MTMRMIGRRGIICFTLLVGMLVPVFGQSDWPSYGIDPGQTRYSTLKQITPANVATLKPAWTYRTGEKFDGKAADLAPQWQTTPIVVGGLMYLSTNRQNVVALEPDTGKEVWRYTLTPPLNPPNGAHRGVSYWPGDSQTSARIIHATSDGRVIALDPKTGTPIATFGEKGVVDTRIGYAKPAPEDPLFGSTSPPAIYKDSFIIGQRLQEGGRTGPAGVARAFSVRTGKLIWTFNGLPQAGEIGNETWEGDSWKGRGGPSLWVPITVDVERSLVFLPWGNPQWDRRTAGDAPGMSLFSDAVTAVDANTGKLKWYFQTTHHDVWDFDLPAAALLIDMVQNGKKVPIVVQTTKLGAFFFLNRLTGKSIFGYEERPVPQTDVPGQITWPTQPFPLKPPLVAITSLKREDLGNLSPESRKFCEDWFDTLTNLGAYTPPLKVPTLRIPTGHGALNWPGPSFDPELGYIFANSTNLGAGGGSPPGRNPASAGRFVDQDLYPCQKPPWGLLNAVNANTGDIVWQVPLGSYRELEAKGIKNTGAPNLGGTMATAGGLVFIGATSDQRFRAFDSRTGKELWMTDLENEANSSPITYMGRDGRQYVVIAATGPGGPARKSNPYYKTDFGDSIVAFALPSPPLARASTAAPKDRPASTSACLDCHGPFETLAATAPTIKTNDKRVINPHRYVPHDSKDAPECAGCHEEHPVPPVEPVKKPTSVAWCYSCHHLQDFTDCKECH